MSKTKQQIAVAVLRKIGNLPTGQTASGADLNLCLDKYEEVWAMLQAPELLADWANGDPVPTIDSSPTVDIVAYELRIDFGVGGETLTRVEAAGNPLTGTAYDRLRANRHTNWTGDEDPTEMEYY